MGVHNLYHKPSSDSEHLMTTSFLHLVRKTGSQQLGARKICFPSIWKWKKLVPSCEIFRSFARVILLLYFVFKMFSISLVVKLGT